MTLAGRTLGIVVSTPESRGDWDRAVAIARAARAQGVEVSVFLMDRGAAMAADPRATVLLDEGCDVTACGTNVDAMRVTAVDGVVVGSQDDHAAILHRADRVVSLT
jgi:sulfur relay (sulfurtransferase) complex TusBCD TusD component (DsrE family)